MVNKARCLLGEVMKWYTNKCDTVAKVPSKDDLRTIRVFCFRPRNIKGITIWLQRVWIKQIYWTYYGTQTSGKDRWVDVEFTTKQDVFLDQL